MKWYFPKEPTQTGSLSLATSLAGSCNSSPFIMMVNIIIMLGLTIPLFRLEIWDPEDLSAAVDGVGAHDELINAVSGSAEGGRIATGSRDGRVSLLYSEPTLCLLISRFSLFHDLLTQHILTTDTDTSLGQEKACTKCGKH